MRYFIVLIGMPFLQKLTAYLFHYFFSEASSLTATYCRLLLQQVVGVYLPVMLCFWKKPYFPKKELLVEKPGYILRCMWLGFLLQFVGIAANFPVTVFLQRLGFSAPSSLPNGNSMITLLLQIVVVCLTPAILEEVLFRRMVYGDLKKQSPKAAVLFSAMYFAMAHFDFHNFAATFIIGLSLGMLRYRGAPLIMCVVTHFFVNYSALILNYLLKIPATASLVDRYFALIVTLAVFLFMLSFPKKLSSQISNEECEGKEHSWKAFVPHPLFWVYLVIFFLLGVKNL